MVAFFASLSFVLCLLFPHPFVIFLNLLLHFIAYKLTIQYLHRVMPMSGGVLLNCKDSYLIVSDSTHASVFEGHVKAAHLVMQSVLIIERKTSGKGAHKKVLFVRGAFDDKSWRRLCRTLLATQVDAESK